MRRRQFIQTAASALLASSRSWAMPADRRTPVIDTHLHCFAGMDDPRFPYHPEGPYQPAESGTPEHMLNCMAESGVDHAVVVEPKLVTYFVTNSTSHSSVDPGPPGDKTRRPGRLHVGVAAF